MKTVFGLKGAAVPPTRDSRLPDVLAVTVNLEDIHNGVRTDAHDCAVGMALRRMGYFPSVHGHIVYVDGVPYSGTYDLCRWIEAFDRGQPVTPERFALVRYGAAQGVPEHAETAGL